jgi:hypothetical protein
MTNLNILACPQIVDGVNHFIASERTQLYMQRWKRSTVQISPAIPAGL